MDHSIQHLQKYLSSDSTLTIFQKAAPRLTSYVETESIQDELCSRLVQEELEYFINKKVDAVVLGCTHYLFLIHEIIKVFPSSITVIPFIYELAQNIQTTFQIKPYWPNGKGSSSAHQTHPSYRKKSSPYSQSFSQTKLHSQHSHSSNNISLYFNQYKEEFIYKSRDILQQPNITPQLVSDSNLPAIE